MFERLLIVGFAELASTTSDVLCNSVVGKLRELALPLECLIGQCFDGASNMSGQHTGLQARIKELSKRQPLFVHK